MPATPKFTSIIFDFDYTLADSSVGIIECVNFALNELRFPAASPSDIRSTIGLSLNQTFFTLTQSEKGGDDEEFVRLFTGHADKVMNGHTVLYDFVPGTVSELHRRGIPMGIVSSKYRYRIETLLDREGIRDSFEVIIGGEDVTNLKPDPQGLLAAVHHIGTAIPTALYVGDSVTDAETSTRAGVPFAAVLSGVTDRRRFDDYNVVHVLENVSQLPSILGV